MVAQCRQHCPDLTVANAELLFNDIYREVMMDVDFTTEAVDSINLTAGTRLYNLPATSMQVHRVTIQTAASTFLSVSPADIGALDKKQPLWRTVSATPALPISQWYIDSDKLGLYPIPDTTTSGSYPVALVYSQKSPTAALVSADVLPNSIPSIEPFMYGVLARFTSAWQPSRAPFYIQQYLRSRAAMDRYTNSRSVAEISTEINPYTGETSGLQRS